MNTDLVGGLKSVLQKEADTVTGIGHALNPSVLSSALEQAKKMIQSQNLIPINRAQKGSTAIASLTNGGTLMSDGTTKGLPPQQQLETLRRNVLQQYPFTPEAQHYLETLPLSFKRTADSLGEYNSGLKNIVINPDVFTMGPTTPTEVLTHEFIHALDGNLNGQADASFFRNGPTSGDSYGFYPDVEDRSSKNEVNTINNFLQSYPKDPAVEDVESFAQYAAPVGQHVLLGPQREYYAGIFKPESTVMNFTPVYPTSNTFNGYDTLFKDLEKQDLFDY